MKTADIRESLKAYVDGELSAEQTEAVRTALELDPSLREEVAALQLLANSLAALRPEIAPTTTDVADLARQVAKRHDRWRGLVWALAPAVAALLIVLLARRDNPADKAGQVQVANDRFAAEIKNPVSASTPAGDLLLNGPMQAAANADRNRGPTFSLKLGASYKRQGGETTRSVIRTGSLTIEVKSSPAAERIIAALVRKRGGIVAAASSSAPTPENHVVSMTLRVPAAQLHATIEAISAVGRVTNRSINSVDVTDAIADNEARLRSLRAQEKTYLRLLQRTNTVNEVLSVEAQLSSVRTNIELVEMRLANANKQVAMSTITVRLQQAVATRAKKSASWLSRAWTNAGHGLADAGRSLVVALIFVAVYSPVWAGGLLLVWLVRRFSRR